MTRICLVSLLLITTPLDAQQKMAAQKRTKEDEKEWLDSIKDAKQTGTNNKSLVPNWE